MSGDVSGTATMNNLKDVTINTTNTKVDNYIAESVEEYCPPFAALVENVVSRFKLHVDQYSNMRNLVREKVDI